MEHSFWQRQTDEPLFPELVWSRPENRAQAGKLLIVGGSGYEFQAPANAYGDALEAGVGTAKVLLPSSMQKTVHQLFPEAEFAPSTPSGSFALSALDQLLDLAQWADGVLFPGNFGRNSETTVLLESFLQKYPGRVTLTKDAADLICRQPESVLHRPDTLLVLAMGQLRELGTHAHSPQAFTSEMGLVGLVEGLQAFSTQYALNAVVKHQGHYAVAVGGRVSTTHLRSSSGGQASVTDEKPLWRTQIATTASVWWLQNPTKPFEALTSSLIH